MSQLKKAALTAGFSEVNSDLVTNKGQIIARRQIADDTVALQVTTLLEAQALITSKDVYGADTYFVQFTTKLSVRTFKIMVENSLVTGSKASQIHNMKPSELY